MESSAWESETDAVTQYIEAILTKCAIAEMPENARASVRIGYRKDQDASACGPITEGHSFNRVTFAIAKYHTNLATVRCVWVCNDTVAIGLKGRAHD